MEEILFSNDPNFDQFIQDESYLDKVIEDPTFSQIHDDRSNITHGNLEHEGGLYPNVQNSPNITDRGASSSNNYRPGIRVEIYDSTAPLANNDIFNEIETTDNCAPNSDSRPRYHSDGTPFEGTDDVGADGMVTLHEMVPDTTQRSETTEIYESREAYQRQAETWEEACEQLLYTGNTLEWALGKSWRSFYIFF
jgi:hypothetical protein